MCNQELSVIIALNPNGRAIMTRDMELIRKIFAEIKSWDDARLHSVDIPGVSDAVLQRHLEMLMEGGLIEAQPVGSYNLSRYLAEWDYKWNTRKMILSLR
jgi:DNA-binding transcriptional ArsR family regulator